MSLLRSFLPAAWSVVIVTLMSLLFRLCISLRSRTFTALVSIFYVGITLRNPLMRFLEKNLFSLSD